MKNTIKTVLLALTLLFLVPSCSKSDDSPTPPTTKDVFNSSFDGTYNGTGTYISINIPDKIDFKVTSATTALITFHVRNNNGNYYQVSYPISEIKLVKDYPTLTSFTCQSNTGNPSSIAFSGTNKDEIVIDGFTSDLTFNGKK